MRGKLSHDNSPALRIACDVSWCAGKMHLAHAMKRKLTLDQLRKIATRLSDALDWVEGEIDAESQG